VKQVQLTKSIYVEPLASRAPTIEEIRIFEQEHISKELEEELEATLNFLRRTTISTAKPVPHVIVILDSEEVEIRPQLVVKEQPQLVHVPRPMEEKELQQPMSSGKTF
jgi:hypothetical protein